VGSEGAREGVMGMKCLLLILTSSFLLCGTNTTASALDCAPPDYFSSYVDGYDLIISGKLIEKELYQSGPLEGGEKLIKSITVEVLSVIKGNYQHGNITILKNDWDSLSEETELIIGNTYIFGLEDKADEMGRYYKNLCAPTFAVLKNDEVVSVKRRWDENNKRIASYKTVSLDNLCKTKEQSP